MPVSKENAHHLLLEVRAGNKQALAELFAQHRERLYHIVKARLDSRLNGRVDADDILQEIYMDASDRIEHYIHQHSGSFFVWLRLITTQTMANVHRRHLEAQARDARREHPLHCGRSNGTASTSIAIQLLGKLTSPSRAAMREETARQLEAAVRRMKSLDREILTLRHFEQLDNKEAAEVLGIQPKAASIRYVRALTRFRELIEGIPSLVDG